MIAVPDAMRTEVDRRRLHQLRGEIESAHTPAEAQASGELHRIVDEGRARPEREAELHIEEDGA